MNTMKKELWLHKQIYQEYPFFLSGIKFFKPAYFSAFIKAA